MTRPALTPERLDEMLEGKKPSGTTRIIWTLPAIGSRIGMGADFVRDVIAKEPGNPIRELGGKYYAFEDDLITFMRNPRGTR